MQIQKRVPLININVNTFVGHYKIFKHWCVCVWLWRVGERKISDIFYWKWLKAKYFITTVWIFSFAVSLFRQLRFCSSNFFFAISNSIKFNELAVHRLLTVTCLRSMHGDHWIFTLPLSLRAPRRVFSYSCRFSTVRVHFWGLYFVTPFAGCCGFAHLYSLFHSAMDLPQRNMKLLLWNWLFAMASTIHNPCMERIPHGQKSTCTSS